MADPNAIAGAAYITVDGDSYFISGDCKYQCSGDNRDPLTGQDGYHGYASKPVPGMISISGRNDGSLSISNLNSGSNVSVVLELVNGKTVVGRNMTRMGEPITVNTEDGTFDLQYVGPDVTEA